MKTEDVLNLFRRRNGKQKLLIRDLVRSDMTNVGALEAMSQVLSINLWTSSGMAFERFRWGVSARLSLLSDWKKGAGKLENLVPIK